MMRLPTPVFDQAGGGGAGGGDPGGGNAGAGGASGGNAGGAGGAGNAGGGQPGGGGGAPAPWYGSLKLNDDVKNFVVGKNFPDVETALSSAFQSDRLVRDRNVLSAPDPQKMGEWDGWEKLGWAKDRKDYVVEEPKIRDDLKPLYSKEMETKFLDGAHELRLSKGQAKGMLDMMVGMLGGNHDAQVARGAQQLQEMDSRLRRDWGRDYDTNKTRAREAMSFFKIGQEDASRLEQAMGAPGLVKFFADLGARMGEDVLRGGAANGASGRTAMSPEQADAELKRLNADKEHLAALNDPRHPQHKAVNARREELTRIKVGVK